ncbi:MAG: Ig-like domain-containing protein [Syntrophomonas sp.]
MNNRFIYKSRIISLVLLLVFSCLLMAAPVLAEGTGDGSGGGKAVPLGLDSSSPVDGAKDVSLTGDVKLTFNKNVIYLQIREANKKCFSLATANGAKVPIEVIMADDQTPEGFEKRREISLHPLQKLQPGTTYTVKISPHLQAKNGTSLGHEETLSFATAGTAAKPAPAAPASQSTKAEVTAKSTQVPQKSSETNVVTTTNKSEGAAAVEEDKTSGVENAPVAEDKTKQASEPQIRTEEKNAVKENPQPEPKSNRSYAIITGLVLIAGAGYLQRKKRKHR